MEQPGRDVTIVDRPGAGDALAAGVLHGLMRGDFARGLSCGTEMSALALSGQGEYVGSDSYELETLVNKGSGGHEQRNGERVKLA